MDNTNVENLLWLIISRLPPPTDNVYNSAAPNHSDPDFCDELRAAILSVCTKYGCVNCAEFEPVRDYGPSCQFKVNVRATRGEKGTSSFETFVAEFALIAPNNVKKEA